MSLTLVVTNITMPRGQTFQMPLTGSDPDGQPLRFSATVDKKGVTAAIAPSSNPSLVLNVSGVDGNGDPFTGDLRLQLFADLTPKTTGRIIDLVNSNFYNGLIFHRVIQGFVAQAGGATTNANFESDQTLDDEFVATLTYDGFGQLAMANLGASFHDSNNSQFFITDTGLSIDNPNNTSPEFLNFHQPIFGQLTSGFDVLSDITSTPVDTGNNDRPLTDVVINSATIINNSQDGVLRLTAAPKFTGVVTVTVSATNAEHQFTTQMLGVKVIADANNSPPFLGPIPSSIVVTQNTAATFIVTSTDIDGDPMFIADGYADSFISSGNIFESQPLTNIVATIIPDTKGTLGRNHTQSMTRMWFRPDVTLTGAVDLVIGVQDRAHGFNPQNPDVDTQVFSLTFVPRSASPTMAITSLMGVAKDGGKTAGDSLNVHGTFAFIGESDHAFGSNDILVLTLGDPTNPLMLTLSPDSTGWKFHNGTVNAKEHVISMVTSNANSVVSSNVSVSAQFNGVAGTFKISAKGFDFPTPISGQVQIGIALGNDYVTDVRTWFVQRPGTFVPPTL
ncbi:MAG TPA: peptidylprolyl isomerase [Verrucomicrobiae bacterium]|nr:peptidylprolyl isomerase [Verrucomicrobiae bacterium]